VPVPPEAPLPIADRPSSPSEITFSVCLAAYQVAPWIDKAIESVLSQTHPAQEIIVCDDGSTDDLDRALARYRGKIILLQQENRGVAAARNAATRVATAQFVVFLDSDDRFLPRRLERLAELAVARPDLDVLTTDAFIEVNGEVIGSYYTETNRFVTTDQRKGILEANFLFGLLAVRRDVLQAVGGFDESMRATSDWDCWIRLIFAGSGAGMIDEPLAVYTLRANSITSARIRLLRGRVAALTKAHDRTDLTPEELGAVRRSLVAAERALAVGEVHEALVSDASDARIRALHVVFGGGFLLRTRAKAFAAAVAPRTCGRAVKIMRDRARQDPEAVLSARQ